MLKSKGRGYKWISIWLTCTFLFGGDNSVAGIHQNVNSSFILMGVGDYFYYRINKVIENS